MSNDAKLELRMHAELVKQFRLRCGHAGMRPDDLVAALLLAHMNQREPEDFGNGLIGSWRLWLAGSKHRLRPWPAEILEAARAKLSQQQQPAETSGDDQPAKAKRRRRRPAAEREAVKPSSRIEAMKANGMRPRG